MMKILCVAEKPSIAKAVAQILSGGQFQASNTRINYIKNYKFSCRFPEWGQCDVVFTSVAGHLTEADFEQPYNKWGQFPPIALFEARIVSFVPDVISFPSKTENRDQKGYMTTLSARVGTPGLCSFGQIVIGRGSISDLRLNWRRRKEIHDFKSNGRNSIIWSKDILYMLLNILSCWIIDKLPLSMLGWNWIFASEPRSHDFKHTLSKDDSPNSKKRKRL